MPRFPLPRWRLSWPRVALSLIALALASSGAIRVGFGVGAALARAPETAEPAAPLQCPEPPLALVQALTQREEAVANRETVLQERLAALDLAEAAVATRLEELRQAEAELERVVTLSDGAAEQDLTRLTAVYEAMKPTEAARLLSAMPADFAAGFLARMRPEAAALVLAGLEPDKAFAITALIAGRNAMAPTE